MNWSKDWKVEAAVWPSPDQIDSGIVETDSGLWTANKPIPMVLILERNDGTPISVAAMIVGDLAVHDSVDSWGLAVTHVPTGTHFDDPINGAVPKGNHRKEALLRWCDVVQTKHGQMWAILRELTPDTYDDRSDRVMKAKDQIRDWCLNTEVR